MCTIMALIIIIFLTDNHGSYLVVKTEGYININTLLCCRSLNMSILLKDNSLILAVLFY